MIEQEGQNELWEDLYWSREFIRLLNPSKDPNYSGDLYDYHVRRAAYLINLLGLNENNTGNGTEVEG